METVIEHFASQRVIPIANFDDPEKAVPLAKALLAGGCRVVEISFRSPLAAPVSIASITAEIPGMFVGAGSLLSTEDVSTAAAAGASFGLAPGFDPNVVKAAADAGFPFVPGALTPSNMTQALSYGCTVQEFFPADPVGPVLLTAALAAFTHKHELKIIAEGGITPETAPAWLAVPQVIAVAVSWVCPKEMIDAEDWAGISLRAQKMLATAGGVPVVAEQPPPLLPPDAVLPEEEEEEGAEEDETL